MEPQNKLIIVSCSKLTNPPLTGYVTGIQCIMCKQELQVTPDGRDTIKNRGGIPLCNKCGFELANSFKEDNRLIGVSFSPEAMRSLQEMVEHQHYDN